MANTELTICGGRYAGQPLHAPDDADVRPMRSRVRQAVFDRISDDLPGCAVLDCFAGTGAMGLEALSRGAESAVFLDRSSTALSCIRRNVHEIRPSGETRMIQCDLLEDRPTFDRERSFQLISVTPPYKFYQQPGTRRKLIDFLEYITREQYVNENANIIVECERGTRFGRPPGTLERIDHRSYGNTDIHWFQRESA